MNVVVVAHERWSHKRGLDYSDLTGRNLTFWKSGHLGEVVAHGGLTVMEITKDDHGPFTETITMMSQIMTYIICMALISSRLYKFKNDLKTTGLERLFFYI